MFPILVPADSWRSREARRLAECTTAQHTYMLWYVQLQFRFQNLTRGEVTVCPEELTALKMERWTVCPEELTALDWTLSGEPLSVVCEGLVRPFAFLHRQRHSLQRRFQGMGEPARDAPGPWCLLNIGTEPLLESTYIRVRLRAFTKLQQSPGSIFNE